jgi:hypothetical protein
MNWKGGSVCPDFALHNEASGVSSLNAKTIEYLKKHFQLISNELRLPQDFPICIMKSPNQNKSFKIHTTQKMRDSGIAIWQNKVDMKCK